MQRDTKLGYGFLLAGVSLPFLIERFLGTGWTAGAAILCGVTGIAFLYSGHSHRDDVESVDSLFHGEIPEPPHPTPIEIEPRPNLTVDFDGVKLGPIYLNDFGIWSVSHVVEPPDATWSDARGPIQRGPAGITYLEANRRDASSSPDAQREYLGMRLRVTNLSGTAKGVVVRTEFRRDGMYVASGAPCPWMDEVMGDIDIGAGHDREAIIAVRSASQWRTVTNIRIESTYPMNHTAMRLEDVPIPDGSLHIAVLCEGKGVAEQSYSWKLAATGAMPSIRKVTPQ